MTDKPDYIRVTAGTPPEPPAQVRVIYSDLINSMPVKDLISWVGQPPPQNPLPDSITSEVSHAF
jgi:hypothetical protein